MVALGFAAAALVATAVLAAAALRLRSVPSFLLAVYLLAAAEIVVLTEVLSLGNLVRARWYAVGQALALVAAALAWNAAGRPRPPLPRVELSGLRRHPLLAVLGLVVLGAVAYQAFLVFATPPNNWDSMSYHLPRAVEWLQRGAVEYYPAHTVRENAFQPNAEILVLWTFAYAGRDTAAAFPQLAAELAVLVGVFAIARRLGFGRPAAAFAALLTATLSEVALQSVTTQNDLLTASFLVSALALLLGRERRELALAGLAVGLAFGTKATALYALPVLALAALAVLPRRRLAEAAAWAAAGVVAVGLYGYVLNLAETGRLLGDPEATETLIPDRTFTGTISTAARLAYRFADLSGFHAPDGLTNAVADAGEWTFDVLGIPANPPESTSLTFTFLVNEHSNEDLSFFGPLGALLVLPLAVGFLVAFLFGRTTALRAVVALAVPLYLLELGLGNRYNDWLGRFVLAGVLLAMPLAAWVYGRRLLAVPVALVGALTLGVTHAFNEAKPTGLGETYAVWSLPRARAQSVLRPQMIQVIEGLEQFVPREKYVGYRLGPDDWTYPLYGPHLDRALERVRGPDLLVAAERQHLHWVFADHTTPKPPPRPNWSMIGFADSGWTLFTWPEELDPVRRVP